MDWKERIEMRQSRLWTGAAEGAVNPLEQQLRMKLMPGRGVPDCFY